MRQGRSQGSLLQPSQRAKSGLVIVGLWLLPLIFLAAFYFYPLGSILRISFARGEGGIAAPLIEALTSSSVRHVFAFTVGQAALSTLLTLVVGLPGAFLLARFDFPGKSLLRAMTGIPFVLPTLVVAAAFNAFLGPQGWVNLALMRWFQLPSAPIEFTNTLTAIITAHVFYNTTIVLRMVGDFWSRIDPRLGAAAQVLGARPWQNIRQVTLPLLLPAIGAASLLVFIFNFTSFGVILVLGGPRFATLDVEIYRQTISMFNLPMAAALAVLQLACTLAMTATYSRLAARVSRPLDLRPRRHTQRRLVSMKEKLLAGILIAVLLTLLTGPLLALATRSFVRLGPEAGLDQASQSRFTLEYYRQLGTNPRGSFFFVPPTTAIGVSLAYAAATVVFALALGAPAAWALSRNRESTLNRLLDPLLMLPLGTSAVTLGLGFIVALGREPLNLRASPILVPLAHTLVAFPFVIRSLTPALQSIQPRLRHAAAVLGASPRNVLRHVDLPLVGRALLVGATFAFTVSIGEFGATALVARPEYPTVPIAIYRFLGRPGALNYGQALAMGTLLMVVTGAGMLAIERLRIAEVGEF